MATSNNPPAPDPLTDTDGPGVYPPFEPVEHIAAEHLPETDSEPDYNEPTNGVDDEPEDAVPEEDPDDEPLAEEDDQVLNAPAEGIEGESDDEIFRQRHAEAEARQSKP